MIVGGFCSVNFGGSKLGACVRVLLVQESSRQCPKHVNFGLCVCTRFELNFLLHDCCAKFGALMLALISGWMIFL